MASTKGIPIQSTAGAISVVNEKGEVYMQKVKVQRYVSGKRPEYAAVSSSEEESDEEGFIHPKAPRGYRAPSPAPAPPPVSELTEAEKDDPRLRRLMQREEESDSEEEHRREKRRHIAEPEVVEDVVDQLPPSPELPSADLADERPIDWRRWDEEAEESEEEELDEDEIERRRAAIRKKALERSQKEEEDLLAKEDEQHSEEESGDESSEYEEYSDSEEEEGPRLKPLFVRKRDRITLIEKEREEARQNQLETEAKKMAEERRKQTIKMVEQEARRELKEKDNTSEPWQVINTDDENDEAEYETWKLRELKRVKRDRDEKENLEKDRQELERLRNLTEDERRIELKHNPHVITNKAEKGKYKFLQKYYHRGAFFMDKEESVYTKDFSHATGEDVFDKTILPKVMQVKNFGRSGRTKYTHLVDQDTTQFDSPWVSETAMNLKFHNNQAGGMKQAFDRPSMRKRKAQN